MADYLKLLDEGFNRKYLKESEEIEDTSTDEIDVGDLFMNGDETYKLLDVKIDEDGEVVVEAENDETGEPEEIEYISKEEAEELYGEPDAEDEPEAYAESLRRRIRSKRKRNESYLREADGYGYYDEFDNWVGDEFKKNQVERNVSNFFDKAWNGQNSQSMKNMRAANQSVGTRYDPDANPNGQKTPSQGQIKQSQRDVNARANYYDYQNSRNKSSGYDPDANPNGQKTKMGQGDINQRKNGFTPQNTQQQSQPVKQQTRQSSGNYNSQQNVQPQQQVQQTQQQQTQPQQTQQQQQPQGPGAGSPNYNDGQTRVIGLDQTQGMGRYKTPRTESLYRKSKNMPQALKIINEGFMRKYLREATSPEDKEESDILRKILAKRNQMNPNYKLTKREKEVLDKYGLRIKNGDILYSVPDSSSRSNDPYLLRQGFRGDAYVGPFGIESNDNPEYNIVGQARKMADDYAGDWSGIRTRRYNVMVQDLVDAYNTGVITRDTEYLMNRIGITIDDLNALRKNRITVQDVNRIVSGNESNRGLKKRSNSLKRAYSHVDDDIAAAEQRLQDLKSRRKQLGRNAVEYGDPYHDMDRPWSSYYDNY